MSIFTTFGSVNWMMDIKAYKTPDMLLSQNRSIKYYITHITNKLKKRVNSNGLCWKNMVYVCFKFQNSILYIDVSLLFHYSHSEHMVF